MGRNPNFEDCMKSGQELRKAYDSDPDATRIVDVARGLEGIVRNASIHAAAVVIADRPLQEIVPVQLAEDRSTPAEGNGNGNGGGKPERAYKIVTQYSMGPIEEIGLLKMDFLGLRNLDVIEDAVEIIRRSHGVELDIETIPLDDPRTYEMLARGESIGVFQLESDGMREALRQVKPTRFEDIIALVALYRPGAMRFIGDYAKGKRDPSSVRYPDPRMKAITESTYGCCIYQEQLMEIAKQMAGFSPAQADDLRKAVGKKKRDLMATMEDKFKAGLRESQTAPALASELWKLMTAAADYSFNKSHAACYGLIAYRTAYLRANYPAEYMAALISSVMSTKDKVPFFVNRCEEMGVEVLPPDVNESDHGFVVSGNKIRFGLDAVKNVGHQAVEAILAARRDGGEFTSIWDFCGRVDARAVNKRAIECLVKCGALDSTGDARKGMLEALPQASASGQRSQEDAQLGQGSIFELGGDGDGSGAGGPALALVHPQHPPLSRDEYEQSELLRMEKETLGTYVSSHPLAGLREALRRRVDCSLAELGGKADKAMLTIGGLIGESKRLKTRSGADMMFATLDDLEGSVELLAFNQVLEQHSEVLQPDRVVVVRGRLDHREDRTSFVVQEAELFEPTVTELEQARSRASAAKSTLEPEALTLRIDAAEFRPDLVDQMKAVFENFRGDTEVLLEMETRDGVRRLRFGDGYRVDPSHGLRAELHSLLGPDALAA